MDAVFIDQSGVKRNFLWQYDKGQTLVVENVGYNISPEVHFETSATSEALMSRGVLLNGTLSVPIPDSLLLEARKIIVYIYVEKGSVGNTVEKIEINVKPRKMPSDYVMSDKYYVASVVSLQDAIIRYLDSTPAFMEDTIVDYTTVNLTDDSTGKNYMVGINNGQLYVKEVT